MHLERVGGRFVAAVLLLAVAGNAAFAQEHKTYRCTVADVAWLDDDGRLRPSTNPKDMLRRLYHGVIIDTLTGAVTFPDGGRSVWNVVRPDTSEDDYVLTRKPAPGLSSDQQITDPATDFIRIRAWDEPQSVRFLAVFLSGLATGPCKVVH